LDACLQPVWDGEQELTPVVDRLNGNVLYVLYHLNDHFLAALSIPRTGGFSLSSVPTPRFPRSFRRQPSLPSLATASG
jgi:hypothetical protein